MNGRLAHLQVHSGELDILQTRLHSVVARDRRAKVDRIRAVAAVDHLMKEAMMVQSETHSDRIRAVATVDHLAIRGLWSSLLISGHQRSSEVISGHHVAVRDLRSSVVISGHPRSSVAIT